jgi:ribonuclease P protein component
VLGSNQEPPRVAFAVGRSVGGAVTRNRVRRHLRSAAREHTRILEPGTAYLVRATPETALNPYADVSDTLRAILLDLAAESS